MIERLVVWAALGTTLSALGHPIDDWGFWCIFGLFWAISHLAFNEGQEQGVWLTANLPMEDLKDIKAQIAKFEEDNK